MRHRNRNIALAALALLAACQRTTPAEKAAQDARDVAQVEAVQKLQPPAQPIVPEPMNAASRAMFNLAEAGCDFLPAVRQSDDPVFIAGQVKALLLVRGQPVILAVDSGSPALGFGVHERFTGRENWAQLTKGPASASSARAPGSLTIRDRFERIVYFSAGELTCREGAPAETKRSSDEPKEA